MSSRAHLHATEGDLVLRLAMRAVRALGSVGFLMAQTVVVAVWVVLNVTAIVRHWDPYPFILLNLAFSTQAAYAAPFILLAQNRQADIDRRRDDLEADEVAAILRLLKERP